MKQDLFPYAFHPANLPYYRLKLEEVVIFDYFLMRFYVEGSTLKVHLGKIERNYRVGRRRLVSALKFFELIKLIYPISRRDNREYEFFFDFELLKKNPGLVFTEKGVKAFNDYLPNFKSITVRNGDELVSINRRRKKKEDKLVPFFSLDGENPQKKQKTNA